MRRIETKPVELTGRSGVSRRSETILGGRGRSERFGWTYHPGAGQDGRARVWFGRADPSPSFRLPSRPIRPSGPLLLSLESSPDREDTLNKVGPSTLTLSLSAFRSLVRVERVPRSSTDSISLRSLLPDADECWTTMTNALQALPGVGSSNGNFVSQFMMGEMVKE